MTDISLTSGMRSNLYALQTTQSLMERTQTRLATGKKVNSALDDPVNYFAAQGHLQRAGDLSTRKDEMSEAVQTVKAADNGIEGISTLIEAAKSLAVSATATSDSTELAALQASFDEIVSQIDDLQDDSGYKGVNLLDSTGALTVSFNQDGDSNLDLAGFDGTSTGLGINALDIEAAATAAITALDGARDTLRTESKDLSSNLSIITARQDFTDKMINTLEDGAAELTAADMNEEGANMLMLQTRQQLSTQSLSLASQAAQSVLRLF